MKNIYDLSFSEIESFIKEKDEPSFRSKQIWEGLYQHRYSCWEDFSALPKPFRQMLENHIALTSLIKVDSVFSNDLQTEKVLFQMNDSNYIESVLLRNDNRLTLCISTQSGCPVGCVFCATGNLGFNRNLTSGEIIEQVIFFIRALQPDNEKLTNIVLMGMGEPFLNYDNTISAITSLNDASGLNIGARRITISTIGIVDRIKQFAEKELQINLSVSLHAPNDLLRQQLVPLARKYPLRELFEICHYYFEKTNRRITFEYVMIGGINDSPALAHELVSLLRGLNCHLNLIPLNPTSHFIGKPSNPAMIRQFGRILLEKGIATSIRDSQGSDIQAGCGQLAGTINQRKQ
ncbi:MAG: 23S rRNA (adenine(2503)-C(2))-methyltransferase RlmN [Anaerolineaceae bacterium]|nr:23S rRNA (adenine(2503)-C(2))-methyltransferase RlmN [Anaerolineaceae bacterium]